MSCSCVRAALESGSSTYLVRGRCYLFDSWKPPLGLLTKSGYLLFCRAGHGVTWCDVHCLTAGYQVPMTAMQGGPKGKCAGCDKGRGQDKARQTHGLVHVQPLDEHVYAPIPHTSGMYPEPANCITAAPTCSVLCAPRSASSSSFIRRYSLRSFLSSSRPVLACTGTQWPVCPSLVVLRFYAAAGVRALLVHTRPCLRHPHRHVRHTVRYPNARTPRFPVPHLRARRFRADRQALQGHLKTSKRHALSLLPPLPSPDPTSRTSRRADSSLTDRRSRWVRSAAASS